MKQHAKKKKLGVVQPSLGAAGFSLIELLIAMLIGSLVMTGVFQVFINSKQSNKVLQAEAEMQESARFAFSVMTSMIQQAGNFGCQAATNASTRMAVKVPVAAENTFKPERIIEGWEAKKTAYGDAYTAQVNSAVSKITTKHWSSSGNTVKDAGLKSKKFSDILKVWYAKPEKARLISQSAGILTFSPLDLDKGDILVINDCQSVSFAQVCKCEDADCSGLDTKANINAGACHTPGNKALDLTDLNLATAEVSILEEAIFFIGKRADSTQGYKKNMPALYVRHLSDNAKPGRKEEIMEGIESMQILYGEDLNSDNSPDYYVSADQVNNWKRVVSLKISLLLRSHDNHIVTGNQALAFNGKPITVADDDHYLRRVFTTTIALRNRNIGF